MSKCTQIAITELLPDRWYVGRGRHSNLGLWNGDCFLVIGICSKPASWKPRKWISTPCIKQEFYFTQESGSFQPFMLVDEGIAEQDCIGDYTIMLDFANSPAREDGADK